MPRLEPPLTIQADLAVPVDVGAPRRARYRILEVVNEEVG
jgi:hypothetical protein